MRRPDARVSDPLRGGEGGRLAVPTPRCVRLRAPVVLTIGLVKAIILDTNELTKDLMLKGLKYQVLEHMTDDPGFAAYVPAVVVEELVANHGRKVAQAELDLARLNRTRRQLGLAPAKGEALGFDYRAYLAERLEEHLGFSIMPWPETSHGELVARAVARTPPFDEKGSGYRDALIWADVVELARSGQEVAFVSSDRVFAGEDNGLAPKLLAEVASLDGSVELVRDFNSWLLGVLPWTTVPDLSAALNLSRREAFLEYYLQSDFQDDLKPTIEDLGLWPSPFRLEIDEVRWAGDLVPVEATTIAGDEALTLVQYDLGQLVDFLAEFPDGVELDPRWRASTADYLRRVRVEGTVDMVLRVAVMFGGEFGFSIEELSWRRADGSGPGEAPYRPESDPNQPALWDWPPSGWR